MKYCKVTCNTARYKLLIRTHIVNIYKSDSGMYNCLSSGGWEGWSNLLCIHIQCRRLFLLVSSVSMPPCEQSRRTYELCSGFTVPLLRQTYYNHLFSRLVHIFCSPSNQNPSLSCTHFPDSLQICLLFERFIQYAPQWQQKETKQKNDTKPWRRKLKES